MTIVKRAATTTRIGRDLRAETRRLFVREIFQLGGELAHPATIIEAPDNATISRVSVELGARGGVAGMTMAAIPLDEFISRLERGTHRRGERKRK